jgi:hypothetical protein
LTDLQYKPYGNILRDFMTDNSFFRGIRGPVGSGKSVACCIEVLRRALQQEKDSKGIRKSRVAVVRNTNPQLRTTTMKTWLDWFPEKDWGKMNWSPPYTHYIRKGDLDLEVIFLALDRPDDVKKLLSLELTMIFFNESREIAKQIIDAGTMRVGRYPSMKDGGPTWYGVIADTNAPDEDHWWSVMSGDAPAPDHFTREEILMLVKPDNWKFFNQPAGMIENRNKEGEVEDYKVNQDAENLKNLTSRYYPNIIQGKTKSWIDVYIMNRLGSIEDGKAIYNEFSKDVHVAKEGIIPVKDVPYYVGIDFGLTPACVFAQQIRGRWLILHEIVARDMGMVRFSEVLRQEINGKFGELPVARIYGDPAGDYRAQTDESTPFQIMRGAGIYAQPAPSNDVSLRLESVRAPLGRMLEGVSGILIDYRCKHLIKGFEGGYQYRRLNVSGERYTEKPDKNHYSHIHDALQYLLLGAGEGKKIMNQKPQKVVQAKRDFDVFTREPRQVVRRRKSIFQRRHGIV